VPSAPTAASATAGSKVANVSWTAPSENGGLPITGYTVTATPVGGGLARSTSVGAGQTSAAVTNLVNGTTYDLSVVAKNRVGSSAPASAGAVMPDTLPGAPTLTSAVRGNRNVTVNWAAPINDGSAITGYRITVYPGGRTVSAPANATSRKIWGLTNGTRYRFDVRALNAAGVGPASTKSEAVKPATVPRPPQDVTAVGRVGNARVLWDAAANGGERITGYQIKVLRTG